MESNNFSIPKKKMWQQLPRETVTVYMFSEQVDFGMYLA